MAVEDPAKVPSKNITSLDITSFDGGLDERGASNAAPNTFVFGRNVMVNSRGLLTHRYKLRTWLPSLAEGEIAGEVFPCIYEGELYYLTASEGRIKYCQRGDSSWSDVGGNNQVSTGPNIINTFNRAKDAVAVTNGVDKLRYVDLKTMTMVQFVAVADPTTAPTATATGISNSGGSKVYYAITFNSTVGETKLSPILTQAVSKSRVSWKTDGTEYVTVTRNNSAPANAKSWNLYGAMDAAGGTIAPTDMMMLASGLDINTTTFMDTGTIPIDLTRGTAPEDNYTDGPIASYAMEMEGRLIFWGIKTAPYDVYISGYSESEPITLNPAQGGYRAELNKGTNYYPMSMVGFRNGQGLPSLTVLFSNTEGLSKQSIMEQQTVTYGNYSSVVWAVTEQNYGAAGVSSPYGVSNYNGGLHFLSTDGVMKMDTEASMQNVLSTLPTGNLIEKTVGSIRNAHRHKVVSTAWNNRVLWAVPSRGYDFNNQIIVYDVHNKDKPRWYTYDIPAQWVGTVSPDDEAAFVYVSQDNHFYQLVEGYVAADDTQIGTTAPFPVEARGALIGLNEAHNAYMAVVQVVFYLTGFVGSVTVSVTYRNESGKLKTKSVKRYSKNSYVQSTTGNWSDDDYRYDGDTDVLGWDEIATMDSSGDAGKMDDRIKIRMNVIASELQWAISTDVIEKSSFVLRSVSYEGERLGVKVDLR